MIGTLSGKTRSESDAIDCMAVGAMAEPPKQSRGVHGSDWKTDRDWMQD